MLWPSCKDSEKASRQYAVQHDVRRPVAVGPCRARDDHGVLHGIRSRVTTGQRCSRRKNASVSPAYVSLPLGVVTTPPGSVFTVPAGVGAVLTTSVLVASASRL